MGGFKLYVLIGIFYYEKTNSLAQVWGVYKSMACHEIMAKARHERRKDGPGRPVMVGKASK